MTTRLRASDYHRTPVSIVNGMLRVAQSFGLARFRLDGDALLDEARRATGFDDFGDERFLEPFSVLIEATNKAKLNPLGRFLAKSNIDRLLQGRLRAEALWKEHPEILERDIADPVVVVGLARSGTTRLHRLLASDSRFLHLKSWESVYPVPDAASFTARDKGEIDPRAKRLDGALKAVLYMSPQVAAVHPLGTMEVEEEIGLLQYAFSTQLFEVINDIPEFAEWLMAHDQFHAYEYMVKLLKTVAWFRRDSESTPWVLKSPQHMQDLNALLHVFPNATLVCPHRDPVKVVGSSCSMAWNSLVRDVEGIDPHEVGQNWLTKTERMLRKNLQERETLCSPEKQHDVLYADITSDWHTVMRDLYTKIDMPFTDEAVASMAAWLETNRQHKHGAHRYSLEDFGLTAAEVEERLAFYRERFNIPVESGNPHLNPAH